MSKNQNIITHHIFNRKDSPNWWYWYTDNDKRIQKSTKFSKDKYTKEQAQMLISQRYEYDDEHDDRLTYTTGWLKKHILTRIEQEGLRTQTINNYRLALDILCEIYGTDYDVESILVSAIWRIQDFMLSRKKAPSTINKTLRFLNASFFRVVKSQIITRNPFAKFRKLNENKTMIFMSKQELQHFIDTINENLTLIGRLIIIIALTGIRRSEVLLIKRNEINLNENKVCITNVKNSVMRKRWIVFPEALREHFIYFLNASNSDYPLKVCNKNYLSFCAKKYYKLAGLSPNYKLHTTRHTFITLAVQNAQNIRSVQKYVDHSRITTTESYCHDTSETVGLIDIGIKYRQRKRQQNQS